MKKLLWTGLCCGAVLLSACSDENGFATTDTGSLRVSLDVDRSILTAGQSRSSLEDLCDNLTTADFTIRLTDADGNIKEWPYESFSGDNIAIGQYTLSAYAGKEGDEGFEKPYFIGSEKVTVKTDQTSPVAITASLGNAAVRVNYSEAFRKYMTEYTASVRTDGSTDGVEYPASAPEESDLFVNPGDASLYVTFTTVNGQNATLKAAEFTTEAKHRYTVTVDINGGQIGDAVMSVTFDDSTIAETREFVLSDELFNSPSPVVTPEMQQIDIIEGSAPAEGGKFNIVAAGGLGAVTLVTESEYLLAQGWPAEIDLLKAGADMQALLRRLGMNALGLWKNPDKLAVVDLTATIAALRAAGDNTTSFRLEVEDLYGKVSDPAGRINVTLSPIEFEITGQELCMAGDETVTVNVAYNGSDLDAAKWEMYHDASGVWDKITPIEIKSLSRAAEANYAVVLPLVASSSDKIQLRVTIGSLPTVNLTVERIVPNFSLAVSDANAYATRALVEVSSDNARPSDIIKVIKLTATADGTPVSGMTAKKVADNLIEVAGLPAGKSIALKGTLLNKEETATFSTESALEIPNGDFENLNDALNFASLNQGGRWKESVFSSFKQTQASIQTKEPAGWATVNAKTASTSHATQNTWFVVPSTVNTTMSWLSTVPKSTVGTNGGTDTPDAFKDLTAYSNSNAMVLCNVAWDASGSLPGDKSYTAAKYEQYCNTNAPNIANRSAGKLFLGSYSYANGTETYNEGVSFTSRPASLTGYYKFVRDAADASETGMVTVQVLSGSQVIAEGSMQLAPAADYTLFTLPLTYAANAPKATQVKVMFASSNHASYNQADETRNIKTTNRVNRYEAYSLGAMLTVDNLKFNY